jgi:hypothetical protein
MNKARSPSITANSNGGIYNNGSHGPAQLFERRTNHRDVTNMNNDCFAGACLTVESSIISDNSGTAVYNTGSVIILNSTLGGNSAGQGLQWWRYQKWGFQGAKQ